MAQNIVDLKCPRCGERVYFVEKKRAVAIVDCEVFLASDIHSDSWFECLECRDARWETEEQLLAELYESNSSNE